MGDLITFREKWCVGEILCCIYEEQLVLNFSKTDCCCKCVLVLHLTKRLRKDVTNEDLLY